MCVCQVKVAGTSPEGKPVDVSSHPFSEAPSREDPAETPEEVDGGEKPEVEQRDTIVEADDDDKEVKPVEKTNDKGIIRDDIR